MTYVQVAFDRRKYGRHLLIDIARISELEGYLIGTPHALSFFDITLVTRGTGSFVLDGVVTPIRPGTVLFSRPGQVRLWETERLDGIALFFEELFVAEFLRDTEFMSRLPFFRAEPADSSMQLNAVAIRTMRAKLAAMQHELLTAQRDSVDLLRAQLHEALVLFARAYGEQHHMASERATHPVVTSYLALIEQEVASTHTVAAYAEQLAVTPGYLRTLCRSFTGMGAKELLERTLVTRASRQLLYSDESIARIGESLGFADASYFSRFFRRAVGVSPLVFRRRSFSEPLQPRPR